MPAASTQTIDDAVRAWRAGDRISARRILGSITIGAPRDAQAWSLLARLALEMKDEAAAIAALDRFLALEPRQPDAWLTLAQVIGRRDGAAAAAACLRKADAAVPQHLGILTNLGAMLGEAGDREAARRILESALRIDERSALTHFNLARLLKEMGQAEEALTHYRRAVALKPDLVPAQHNLGNLLLDLDRFGEAIEAFRAEAMLRLGPAASGLREERLLKRTNAGKLHHDIEQLRYLRGIGVLDGTWEPAIADHEAALAALPAPAPSETTVEIPPAFAARLKPTYNRINHWDSGARIAGPALNPDLDVAAIEAMYRNRAPGIAWFDDLLTPEALRALRRFCLNSTIWNEFRYSNGYLGAMVDRGFACPLLEQIARELSAALPGIFAGHPLAKTWAFKYDSRLSGIPIHADFAAVNVNFWLTPDDANLEPGTGGLGIWDKEAPLDWDFAAYNKNEPAIRAFLKVSGASMVNVPHRQNRAVMFNSDLFHETGALHFKEGYENRRINVTMLFGRRGG